MQKNMFAYQKLRITDDIELNELAINIINLHLKMGI